MTNEEKVEIYEAFIKELALSLFHTYYERRVDDLVMKADEWFNYPRFSEKENDEAIRKLSE